MDQNSQQVLELDLLNDNRFGLVTYELTGKWVEEENRRESECKSITFHLKRTKELKAIARTGLSNTVRRRYWFILSGGYDLYNRVGNVYQDAVATIKNLPISEKASFGVSFKYLDFLPPQIASIIPTFLNALWYNNQDIDYSPMVPAIATMLLMYMEPSLAYLSIQAIINRSRQNLYYILLNKSQLFASIEAVEKLIISRLSNVANHAQKLGISLPQLILSLFPSFFIPFISYPVSLTFFDSFVSEGRKVFFRFLLQILYEERRNLINTSDENEFVRLIFNSIERLNDPDVMKSFIKKAFKIKMTRKLIFKKLEKMSSEIPHHENIELNFSQLHEMLPPSYFKGRAGHRRTRTLDSKAKKAFKSLKLNELQNANQAAHLPTPKSGSAEVTDESRETTESSEVLRSTETNDQKSPEKTIDQISSENINNDKIDSAVTKSSINIILDSKTGHSSSNDNDNSNNSSSNNEIDLNIAKMNNSSDFIAALEVSKQKVPPPSILASDQAELENVKDMQNKIVQRWLPLVYSHGEQNIIFTDQMLLLVRNQLPPVFRLYSADLVFKMSVNGSNFQSLFSRCKAVSQYIMIVKTTEKVIGAFLSDPIVPKINGRYYGTAMTFVFDMSQTAFYKVRRPVNDYFISVSDDTIMIGGPDPAFFIKNGFAVIRSGNCETFNSPVLTKNENGDHIVDLEMYRFIPQHFFRQRRKSINSIQKHT